MLAAVLERVGQLVRDGHVDASGLTTSSRIVQFLKDQSLRTYLALDDTVIWASLHEMTLARDAGTAELSSRLLKRKLYKAIDVTAQLKDRGGEASVARFRARLAEVKSHMDPLDVLEDQPTRSPYEHRGFDSPDALSKVLIRRADGTGYEDLAERSRVVAALQPQSTFRVYVRNDGVKARLDAIMQEIAQ